jgi:hypothetical protein
MVHPAPYLNKRSTFRQKLEKWRRNNARRIRRGRQKTDKNIGACQKRVAFFGAHKAAHTGQMLRATRPALHLKPHGLQRLCNGLTNSAKPHNANAIIVRGTFRFEFVPMTGLLRQGHTPRIPHNAERSPNDIFRHALPCFWRHAAHQWHMARPIRVTRYEVNARAGAEYCLQIVELAQAPGLWCPNKRVIHGSGIKAWIIPPTQ